MKSQIIVLFLFLILISCKNQEKSYKCDRQIYVLLVDGTLSYDDFVVKDDQVKLKCCYDFVYDESEIKINSRVIQMTFLTDSIFDVKTKVMEISGMKLRASMGKTPRKVLSEKNIAEDFIHTIYLKAWYNN